MKDGYLRIAPDVFMRAVTNRKGTTKHFRRIIVGNIVVYFHKMGYNVITKYILIVPALHFLQDEAIWNVNICLNLSNGEMPADNRITVDEDEACQ